MKIVVIFASALALMSCNNDTDKINSVKKELNKIYTDKNMIENLDYQIGKIKDKDTYNILYNFYEKDYMDGLKDGVEIKESKINADKFKKLEYEAKGEIDFTKVHYLRVVEKDTVLDGTYYLKENTIIGSVYNK